MKSYIKLSGLPVLKAIKALEKIAVDMPEVCIWDTLLDTVPLTDYGNYEVDFETDYFNWVGEVPEKRCGKIISKSGEKAGEYDFYFEWNEKPTMDQLNGLIEKIDTAFAALGCRYSITTK